MKGEDLQRIIGEMSSILGRHADWSHLTGRTSRIRILSGTHEEIKIQIVAVPHCKGRTLWGQSIRIWKRCNGARLFLSGKCLAPTLPL